MLERRLTGIFGGTRLQRRNIAAGGGKLAELTNPKDRDASSDEPGGGTADRPAGTVDEDANPPLSDPEDDAEYGGTGTLPPKDTGAAVPPYEGRT